MPALEHLGQLLSTALFLWKWDEIPPPSREYNGPHQQQCRISYYRSGVLDTQLCCLWYFSGCEIMYEKLPDAILSISLSFILFFKQMLVFLPSLVSCWSIMMLSGSITKTKASSLVWFLYAIGKVHILNFFHSQLAAYKQHPSDLEPGV